MHTVYQVAERADSCIHCSKREEDTHMEDRPSILPFTRKEDVLKDARTLLHTLAEMITIIEKENRDSEPLHLALEQLSIVYEPSAVLKEQLNLQRINNTLAGQAVVDTDAPEPNMDELRRAVRNARTALLHSDIPQDNVVKLPSVLLGEAIFAS